jgi:hypothetical protein
MKGAATIEELRRAVVTLQRRDRETRAQLREMRSHVDAHITTPLPSWTGDKITFTGMPWIKDGTYRRTDCPTDSTAAPPPAQTASRAPASFLSRFLQWFKA